MRSRLVPKSEDRLSQLPDPLISDIISHLSTKEAVTTSVLSTRWRTLWLCLPCLELNSEEFADYNAFLSFGARFFDSNRVSCLQKVKLAIDDPTNNNASYLKPWFDAAVRRKVQHLHVWCLTDAISWRKVQHPRVIYEMPISLYSCETMVSLKLYGVNLDKAEFVSLPCLKTMHLERIRYPDDATFERLVSNCPILEELQILECLSLSGLKVFKVHSLSLKRLKIQLRDGRYLERCDRTEYQVVIDAPLLSCLETNGSESVSYLVKNLNFNAKLDIHLGFALSYFDLKTVSRVRNGIRELVSKVGEMVIDQGTFKVFHRYSILREPLPQFHCMSRLNVTSCAYDLEWVPTFLECCPNLKYLILALGEYSRVEKQISFSSAPECLLSSLISVDIKTRISAYNSTEMLLAKYFLKNSMILKKLTLRLSDGESSNANFILNELLKISRASATCEVVVL